MKKNTFYFDHDYNAQNDPKIEKMICEKGNSAYGVFWRLIERLAQEPNHKLKTEYKILAYSFHENADFIKSVIEDFDLFLIKNGFFSSQRLDFHFKNRNLQAERGRKGGIKKAENKEKKASQIVAPLESSSSEKPQETQKEPQIQENQFLENPVIIEPKKTSTAEINAKKGIKKSDNLDEKPKKQSKPKINNYRQLNDQEFRESLVQYEKEFSTPLILRFYAYWSEKNSDNKMKFQLKDTWETKKRLIYWRGNDEKLNSNTQVINNNQPKQFLTTHEKVKNAMYESTLEIINQPPRKSIEEEREDYIQKKIREGNCQVITLGNKTT